jgi:hypothetical protein
MQHKIYQDNIKNMSMIRFLKRNLWHLDDVGILFSGNSNVNCEFLVKELQKQNERVPFDEKGIV